jgi:phage regulator Rha-like protein
LDLVIRKGKEVFTNSWVISEGSGNSHRAVIKLIEKYSDDFRVFGKLTDHLKSMNNEDTRHTIVYDLNEPQATFLMTLLGNSDKVVDFKLELVRQFYAIRKLLQEQQSSEWMFYRNQGKSVRLAETDTLKELVEYAKTKGSTNHNKIYGNYTRLANKTVGIKSIKDATTMQLNLLMLVENMFSQIILLGMEGNKDYHDIYQDCKVKAIQLSNTVTIGITA